MGDAQHLPDFLRQLVTVRNRFTKIQDSIQAIVDKGPDGEFAHTDVPVVETAELKVEQASDRAKEISTEIVRLHIAAETENEPSTAKGELDDILEVGCDILAQVKLLRLPISCRPTRRRAPSGSPTTGQTRSRSCYNRLLETPCPATTPVQRQLLRVDRILGSIRFSYSPEGWY